MEGKLENNTKQRFGTKQITTIGMLSGISIMLGITGYGFIPLLGVKATIMHIPVIIGAILEGPIIGMMIGLIFGIFSIIQAIMMPTPLSFAFMNPLVAVLPRVIIGITSYYAYKLLPIKSESVKVGVGTAIGSLTNTFGVLTMIYLLYAARFAQTIKIPESTAAKAIYGIAVTNGLPEAAVAIVITIPVIAAVKKIRKR